MNEPNPLIHVGRAGTGPASGTPGRALAQVANWRGSILTLTPTAASSCCITTPDSSHPCSGDTENWMSSGWSGP